MTSLCGDILILKHLHDAVPYGMHSAVISLIHPVKHTPVYLFWGPRFNLFAVDSLISSIFTWSKTPPSPTRTNPSASVRFLNLLNFALAVT